MHRTSHNGFTLVEILIASGIALALLLAVYRFQTTIFSIIKRPIFRSNTSRDIRTLFKQLPKEIRNASTASNGEYAIAVAEPSTLTFYANVDTDALVERVRYFLDGTTLKRGVIKPTGSPLTYTPASETVSSLIQLNQGTTPLFHYFDSHYTGTEAPLTPPIDIPRIRLIEITCTLPDQGDGTHTFVTSAMIRNLKDNL